MRRLAVITGATNSIGYELTKLIAKENIDILMIAIDDPKEDQKDYEFLKMDLVNDFDEEKILEAIGDRSIKYFINNAGFGDFGNFSEVNLKKQEDMINLNIMVLTKLTKMFFDNSKKFNEDVYLLNLGSMAGFMSGPLMSVYYATKAYVVSFTEAIRYENRNNKNIHISVLCPGPTNTNFIKSSNLENSGLFYKMKTMSAENVAKIAFDGLKDGKGIIIPGILNKISIYLAKFSPRILVNYVTYLIMKNK